MEKYLVNVIDDDLMKKKSVCINRCWQRKTFPFSLALRSTREYVRVW